MKTAMAALALLLARADAQESQNFRDPSPHQVRFIELGDGQPLILLAGSRNSGHVFDGFAEQLSGITAQVKSNSPAFEAASVKPSRRRLGRDAGSRVEMGAGAVTARNVTLKQLISSAYRVQPELIVGGPRWLDESEYDIEAKASGPSSAEAIRGMLRALLVERFGLKAHRESRQMRVYALVQDKGGAKIRPLENDAAPGAADFRGDLRQFASFISLRLTIPPAFDPAQPSIAGGPQVPVLDETGMEGVFEFNLDLKPELGADSFTLWQRALREQLGLRLESRMEQVETLVVDRAAKIPQAD